MEQPNQPTSEATTATRNNRGICVREVVDNNGSPYPLNGSFLEVYQTDEKGKPEGECLLSCFVADCETKEEAVRHLLAEFQHPFGAAWDSPEEFGKQLEAVKWLADFYGIAD
jgi:hypothetical protein